MKLYVLVTVSDDHGIVTTLHGTHENAEEVLHINFGEDVSADVLWDIQEHEIPAT